MDVRVSECLVAGDAYVLESEKCREGAAADRAEINSTRSGNPRALLPPRSVSNQSTLFLGACTERSSTHRVRGDMWE